MSWCLSPGTLAGNRCSSSKEREPTSSSKEVLSLRSHLSTPVVNLTFLPSSFSLWRTKKEKRVVLLLKSLHTDGGGVEMTFHLFASSAWSLELKRLLWVRYLQSALQAPTCSHLTFASALLSAPKQNHSAREMLWTERLWPAAKSQTEKAACPQNRF